MRMHLPILFAAALIAAAPARAQQGTAETSAPPPGTRSAKPQAADETPDEPGEHAAEPVTLGFHVYDIRDLDLKNGTFFVDFYFWMRHAKQKDPEHAKEIEKIEFMNGKVDTLDESERKDVGAETYICWRGQGTFHFYPSLRNYPFDRQRLEIQVEHPLLELSDVVYQDDVESYKRSGEPSERWGLKEGIFIPEYSIVRADRRSAASEYKTDFGDPAREQPRSVYSRFVISVTVARNFGPYFFKIILPLVIILGMAYLVFFLPPKEIQTASGLAITALLSCIAFDVTVSQSLPEVGYLVVSDKFFIVTYFLIFLNLMQSIATYVMFDNGSVERAAFWERLCRYVFPLLYAAAFAYLLIEALVLN